MEQKSAFITIIGRPNVGKSSLMNKRLGQKVAIVSDKPQTTRTRIMGVLTKNENQLVFIDTPGFHKPRNLLGQNMIKAVGEGLGDVDGVVLVVDAAPDFKFDPENLPPAEIQLIENLRTKKLPCVLVINKIDMLPEKEVLLDMISAYTAVYPFETVIPLSAKTGCPSGSLRGEIRPHAEPHRHPAPCASPPVRCPR